MSSASVLAVAGPTGHMPRKPGALPPAAAPARPPGGSARATPTSRPTPSTAPPRSFTIAVAGDVLVHLPLAQQAAEYGTATGVAFDFDPMLGSIAPIVSKDDLAICHLETPLSGDGRLSGYPRFSTPRELAADLAQAGFDACSTVSNHSLDQGVEGVYSTLDALDAAGLGHSGTARSLEEAMSPHLYDVKGVRVAHLAYTYGFNGLPVPPDAPWLASTIDPPRILADAAAARAAGAEFVVVSLHWGAEYRQAPTDEQQRVARQLLASPDIDLLVGHHAHVVQPVEQVGDEYVLYGLGNLLSNQSAACCPAATQDGVIVEARVTEHPPGRFAVSALRFAPTWVDHSGYRVLPIAAALRDAGLTSAAPSVLYASWQRTGEALTALGAPGLQPAQP